MTEINLPRVISSRREMIPVIVISEFTPDNGKSVSQENVMPSVQHISPENTSVT